MMDEVRTHLTDEDIDDYLDGLLLPAVAARTEAHLAGCASCHARVHRVRQVLAEASALPRSVLPPRDLWPAMRAELVRRGPAAASLQPSQPLWTRGITLAIAAGVLVLVSVPLTYRATRHGASAVASSGASPASSSGSALPARYAQIEADYRRAAEELRASLESQRASLAPETIARVERSLAVIDQAIAEARGALIDDPRNQTLADMLAAGYRRRLDLLRRAAELPSGT